MFSSFPVRVRLGSEGTQQSPELTLPSPEVTSAGATQSLVDSAASLGSKGNISSPLTPSFAQGTFVKSQPLESLDLSDQKAR